MKKRKLKNTFTGKKKGPEFHFPTHFQHTFIWEKKKRNTSNTRLFGRKKKGTLPTHVYLEGKKKKEVEKLSNWQG